MRLSIAALTILLTASSGPTAEACCLTDCLFGRTTAPYAVGYAPYAYAPTAGYQANYGSVSTFTAPAAAVPTTTSVLRPTWGGALPLSSNSVYQSQRPAYYNNPSVHTGLPVTAPVPSAATPVVRNYRGTAPASSYLGAANAYPSNPAVAPYAAARAPASPGLPLPVNTPTGAPVTALPATPVAPLFPPTAPRPSGLSRFFGSLFGTNYRTSYYRAPVTYYRPATTVDPISGSTVTVQRPCTAYTQQVQRTPYSSLQPPAATAPPTYIQPGATCTTPGNYGPPPGSVGQVGAAVPPASRPFTVPIPSTTPSGSYPSGGYSPNASPPNAAPLTGPPAGGVNTAPQSRGDMAPVDQPELRNRQPSDKDGYKSRRNEDVSKPKSYWELQNAEDSTAMIRPSRSAGVAAQPIQAPPDYTAPRSERFQAPPTPVRRDQLEAPPLPPRSFESVDSAHESNWVSAPVREASVTKQGSAPRAAVPIKRDTSWTPVR